MVGIPEPSLSLLTLFRFLVNSHFYVLDAARAFVEGRQRIAVVTGGALVSVVSQSTLLRCVLCVCVCVCGCSSRIQ
jgi:hypothetical protein